MNNKLESWDKLRRLGEQNSLPWLVCGEFNEILYANEKQQGFLRDEHCMAKFWEIVEECCLVDLGFSRPMFT